MSDEARQLANARAHGYALLADLVARGVREDNLELAKSSPRLEPLLVDASLEELAAEHFHVFDLVAPANEGLLLDPEGRSGSTASLRLDHTLRIAGGIDIDSAVELESLAGQLDLLARISAAEAEALANGDEAEVERNRVLVASLLDLHLLQWLLPYEAAVQRCGRAFSSALLAEVVDLTLAHRAELAARVEAPELPAVDSSLLDLDNPETDLRDIARALTRPAICGMLLTRDDIQFLGRNARVPRGFGGRTLELLNLLRNSAELGELSTIVAGLNALLDEQERSVNERLESLPEAFDAFAGPWTERAAVTRKALKKLGAAAAERPAMTG
jgi:hypothetical protein